jgi:hypothetical protein
MLLIALSKKVVTQSWPVATTGNEKHTGSFAAVRKVGQKITKSLILRVCFTKERCGTEIGTM